MRFRIVSIDGTEPVDLATAKNWVKKEYTQDDALITGLISSARETAETELGFHVVAKTIDQGFLHVPSDGVLFLGAGPVVSITSISYIDEDDNPQTIDPNDTFFDSYNKVRPVLRIGTDIAIQEDTELIVIYTVGSTASESFKTAMQLMIGDWDINRQNSIKALSSSAEFILLHDRVHVV